MNGEKYSDPTADEAIKHVEYEQEMDKVCLVAKIIRLILELAGLEIVTKIKFRSKLSGRFWS